jgi:hypothetical protein
MGEIQGTSHLTVLIPHVNNNSKNIAGSSVRSSHSLLLTSTESAFPGQVARLRFCAIIEGRLGLWDYSFGDNAPISPGEGTVSQELREALEPLLQEIESTCTERKSLGICRV